jgi:ribosomal protein L21E
MNPLKDSQRINYATSYILHITYLYKLVTPRKNLDSVAISINPLNAIWNTNQSHLHDGKTGEIQSHHINTLTVKLKCLQQQWNVGCKLV